jgi:NAD(P)-dependent dehydrogenase (short-subunit alcohol dehydrogenase family)
VLQFVKDGCKRLVVTDLISETLKITAEIAKKHSANVQIELISGDITSEQFIANLVAHVVKIFGRLDYAVNNAGIAGKPGQTHEMNFEDYKVVQKVNVDALWLCQREELKAMVIQDTTNKYTSLSSRLLHSLRKWPWSNRQYVLNLRSCCISKLRSIHCIQTCGYRTH